jgi:LysR family transcriptional regulator (chromosome initiation inhibitor)
VCHQSTLNGNGVVMGAVTTERTPVPGCRVHPLGVMRYVPDGFTASAAANAPSLALNRDDALQDMLVRKAFRRAISRPTHFVPTAEGFGAAVRAGLGWLGHVPEETGSKQAAMRDAPALPTPV